ncbi:hypothetical protein ACFPZ0_27145 [Streptomonospora nanhaiensis]|uniref:hypothetical protein n=1 Tax=Streptomonospora nanhaiensis TaxID=1323731 RepID=UPI001C99EDD1|nr:hypothetical protein [Streptomonospora nanhaiensis]MBX9388712.1 hypothetical protein [Streptomonospora nanhaiensis]
MRYLPVELNGKPIGYVYVSTRTRRASFVRILSSQDNTAGFEAAMEWSKRLERARRKPYLDKAVEEWIGAPQDEKAGRIPEGARFTTAESVEALTRLANPGYSKPPLPSASGYLPDGAPVDRPATAAPLDTWRTDDPDTYRMATDKPVLYLPVRAADGTLLGHLWASQADEDNAAGFARDTRADAAASRAAGVWLDRLNAYRRQGLAPREALQRVRAYPADPVAGAVPQDARAKEAGSSKELRLLGRR